MQCHGCKDAMRVIGIERDKAVFWCENCGVLDKSIYELIRKRMEARRSTYQTQKVTGEVEFLPTYGHARG